MDLRVWNEWEVLGAVAQRAARAGPTTGWSADLTAYLRHERVKSAIVDSIRYTKELAAGTTAPRRRTLVHKLTATLNTATPIWTPTTALTPQNVNRLLIRAGFPPQVDAVS